MIADLGFWIGRSINTISKITNLKFKIEITDMVKFEPVISDLIGRHKNQLELSGKKLLNFNGVSYNSRNLA